MANKPFANPYLGRKPYRYGYIGEVVAIDMIDTLQAAHDALGRSDHPDTLKIKRRLRRLMRRLDPDIVFPAPVNDKDLLPIEEEISE